jgi:tetratricopeptide (TPR) repeat protein
MSFDDQAYEQIASYLNNQMVKAEKATFEVQLTNDAKLASFVDTFSTLEGVYNEDKWTVKSNATLEEVKELANEFRTKDVLDLSKKIRAIQENTNQERATRSRKSYFYYISSAVAIAAVCTLFYFSFKQSITATDAFEQYHDWTSLPSFQTKSASENNLAKASALFQEEKYQEALAIFTKESDTYNPQIQLYIGISQLELENYHEAIQTFDKLLNSNTVDNHKAYWYTSLTYLKQNDAEKAKKVLNTLIENPTNYNYEKARKLLKKLK